MCILARERVCSVRLVCVYTQMMAVYMSCRTRVVEKSRSSRKATVKLRSQVKPSAESSRGLTQRDIDLCFLRITLVRRITAPKCAILFSCFSDDGSRAGNSASLPLHRVITLCTVSTAITCKANTCAVRSLAHTRKHWEHTHTCRRHTSGLRVCMSASTRFILLRCRCSRFSRIFRSCFLLPRKSHEESHTQTRPEKSEK